MHQRSISSDLPEVVPSENYGALQVIYDGIEHHPETAHDTATSKDAKYWEKSHLKALQFAWWRRRLWLMVALGILVFCSIVGAIVASVMVSRDRDNSTESEPSPTISSSSTTTTATSTFSFGSPTVIPESLPPSTCLGSMCPQMLSVASLAKGSTAFLFGRGADQAIWYRRAEGEKWITKWTSLGGTFVSSPTSLSIREGRIDVFAVDQSQEVQFKSFQNGEWADEWTTLYGSCSSQPSSTTFGVDKLSLICVNADHRLQLKYYKGRWGPSISEWQDLGSSWLSSTPALDSGALDQVDIVAYGIPGAKMGNQQGADYSMIYKRYNTTDWQDWEGGWGSFKGDPEIIAVAKNQIEYFGVDKDGAMWHNAWLAEKVVSPSTRRGTNLTTLPPEYTDPEKLGGNFTSAPFAFATGNSRIDVLAVGIDGRLKHQARIGKTWAQDWEDLGGYFKSAPLALTLGDSTNITVFGLGPNGTVLHGSFSKGERHAWGRGSCEQQRKAWAFQIGKTNGLLHDGGITLGDAKADNVLGHPDSDEL
ncbi:putative Sialidase [Fusarium austroafricanum]|uniref:Putative Sialidase n=1 Tax=Fusarium austroafricanum TaxID=2364996 RepID=A0A8H4JNP3_9HYPO|nr:putative Sialidase [Fusarium austroafricanum]